MSSVVSIIFNQERNGIILIKRRDVPVWALPGGGIEKDETPEDAAIRETFEETGLQTSIVRKVAEYTPLNRLCHLTHLFECRDIGGISKSSTEAQEVALFPLDKLPDTLFFLHKEWIAEALLNHPGLIRKPITQVTYLKFVRYFIMHPLNTLRFAFSRLGMPINSRK